MESSTMEISCGDNIENLKCVFNWIMLLQFINKYLIMGINWDKRGAAVGPLLSEWLEEESHLRRASHIENSSESNWLNRLQSINQVID